MPVYRIDPLADPRWPELLARHPAASVFHTRGWMESLRRTYGYEPFVLTTTPPGSELENGLPFCRIRSWLTGERLVSLPFADHCQPLFDDRFALDAVLEEACCESNHRAARYVEIRPLPTGLLPQSQDFELQHSQLRPGSDYLLHRLDLRPGLKQILQSFDHSSIQRPIRRGERLELHYEEGTSTALLHQFYRLQVLTRRRHRLPPQPLQWFRNLVELLPREAKIRVLSVDGAPAASILTLLSNRTMLYKYGCSDPKFNRLQGTTHLFWRTIQEAKEQGAQVFDLGRSDPDNDGLIRFKSKWGTEERRLTYWRFPQPTSQPGSVLGKGGKAGRQLMARLPDAILILLGKALYKHAG